MNLNFFIFTILSMFVIALTAEKLGYIRSFLISVGIVVFSNFLVICISDGHLDLGLLINPFNFLLSINSSILGLLLFAAYKGNWRQLFLEPEESK